MPGRYWSRSHGPLEFKRAFRLSSQPMNALTRTEIIRLTATERLTLIGDLWDSLDDAEAPVSPAQTAELERRLASFEDDRAGAVTWDQLRVELADRNL
jgi:putative addiction module component (TIGR02574 family)